MNLSDIILTVFIPLLFLLWPRIYRFIFLPWRQPDFKYRHYEYWFERNMVAYSHLTGYKFRFEEAYYDLPGNVKARALRKILSKNYYESGILDIAVQQAYKRHIDKTFEEIVLDDET